MNEKEGRTAIIASAIAWLGTPYKKSNVCIRHVGANCATLIYGIARDAGVLASDAPQPYWYSPQFHLHSREEKLLARVKNYGCVEISEREVEPGDIVAYLSGQSHGHLALIIEMPRKIVQTTEAGGCQYAGLNDGVLAHCARKYFTLWPKKGVR